MTQKNNDILKAREEEKLKAKEKQDIITTQLNEVKQTLLSMQQQQTVSSSVKDRNMDSVNLQSSANDEKYPGCSTGGKLWRGFWDYTLLLIPNIFVALFSGKTILSHWRHHTYHQEQAKASSDEKAEVNHDAPEKSALTQHTVVKKLNHKSGISNSVQQSSKSDKLVESKRKTDPISKKIDKLGIRASNQSKSELLLSTTSNDSPQPTNHAYQFNFNME